MTLSVVVIAYNEEANIMRTLEGVRSADERIVVDCGSTDATVEIARQQGATVYQEAWKGYSAQKNSAIAKANSEWILSLDADEEVEPELMEEIHKLLEHQPAVNGYSIPRKNYFLGRWMRHGGYYPDRKLRLFRRGCGLFGERPVHESLQITGAVGSLTHALVHRSHATLEDYIDHMNRYSSLGAEIVVASGKRSFSWFDIVFRPWITFLYNYVFRLGLLDGRAGLLLHLYHAAYVSWKYSKAWELAQRTDEVAQRELK